MLLDSEVDELVADTQRLMSLCNEFIAKWTPRQERMLAEASPQQIERLAKVWEEAEATLQRMKSGKESS